jgi:hypothetical protein
MTMREITEHVTNEANRRVHILADEHGHGGASHRYEIVIHSGPGADQVTTQVITFQDGPIKEVGVNGTTHEVLLAILADRLRSFQAGPYADDRNKMALAHVLEAAAELNARTRERETRGVEGTHQV